MTVALVTAPPNGTVVLNADGSFTYDPEPAFAGTDSFTYQASDDNIGGVSDVATVTITVDETGEPPTTTPTSTSAPTSGGGAPGGGGRGMLPATGGAPPGLVLVALLLVTGGSVVVAMASRRRPSTDDR